MNRDVGTFEQVSLNSGLPRSEPTSSSHLLIHGVSSKNSLENADSLRALMAHLVREMGILGFSSSNVG